MKKIILTFAFVLISTASHADWTKMTSFPTIYVNDIFITGNTFYAATNNNGIYKSTDGTATWQQISTGLNNAQAIQCTQVILVGNILYASTVDGIYKSTDFGSNWVKKSAGILVGNGATFAFCESVYELNGTLFTGAYTGLYRSTDGAENWTATNITGMHIWAKDFTPHNGIIFAARESINSPIGYKSTDNGMTWSSLTGLSFYNTITFFSEPGKLFAGTIHGVWLSTDNGASWVARSTGLPPDPYNSGFVRANGVLVSCTKFGGSGMHKSSNDGVQWVSFNEGLPFLSSIEEIIMSNNKILAATSGGIYERNISELTGVNQISSQVPEKFSLSQNYPNPFNPSTKIKFDIPVQSQVKLTIFDAAGKEVAVPVNSNLSSGSYEVSFDASALAGSIYFYRIEAGEFSKTRKMILIK